MGLGIATVALVRRKRNTTALANRRVLITGGSRGLGLALAREFLRRGCRVAICARDAEELSAARHQLGASVHTVVCDVADRAQVRRLTDEVTELLGGIDVLVANAGTMDVGPIEAMREETFRHAFDVMFWGVLYPTMAVLPQMCARRSGRIVTITSIGGKLSVPHMLPYSCAKFAAVGLSEGLRAEMANTGIRVTTVVPGLMRTGSYVNARFRGDQEAEFTWFGLGASLPGISIAAEHAARIIVDATARGDSEVVLSAPAKVAAAFHGLFPGTTADLLGWVDRVILPRASRDAHATPGSDLEPHQPWWFRALATLGRGAQRRLQPKPAR